MESDITFTGNPSQYKQNMRSGETARHALRADCRSAQSSRIFLSWEASMTLLRAGISPQDRFLGPLTARVHIILYADFECPHSKRAYRSVKELASWYGNLVC